MQAKNERGLTTIGLLAGAEVGAEFFRPWRVGKARKEFVERGVDFIMFLGCLLNIEGLNQRFLEFAKGKIKGTPTRKLIKEAHLKKFCNPIIEQILRDVCPPLYGREGKIIKYWIFPCPLFELKPVRDKFGIAAWIYNELVASSISKIQSKDARDTDPYIRVCSDEELIEVEDTVAVRSIGVVMPTTSFFRSKILSTPIEREITYRQLSSLPRSIPDLYVAGSFAVCINEVNPRSIPLARPYVSIPSLSIKFTESVLQNTLGYAILSLYPDQKNRADYELSVMPLNDSVELECRNAGVETHNLKDRESRLVAEAIIEKVRVGTKVTAGKIENATGLSRNTVIKTIKKLKERYKRLEYSFGEVMHPYSIIPNVSKDLTEYRLGVSITRRFIGCACLHAGDVAVDYDFLEKDLPEIIFQEKADTLYLVGDLTEGNKYDQDRKGQLIDRFSLPQYQKELAGFLCAAALFRVFKMNFEIHRNVQKSFPRVVAIPGNHDDVKNEPSLDAFERIFLAALRDAIFRYLASRTDVDDTVKRYDAIGSIVREKMKILGNPSMDGNVGLIHEYSQSAEQSTGKTQKASKQFMTLSKEATLMLLANHHEENFSLVRVGNRTMELFHIGTLKRFYSFESQRSKISEFGVAVVNDHWTGDQPVRVDVKFIPSRIAFAMKDADVFWEQNRIRGIMYWEILKKYKEKGELPWDKE